MRTAAILGSLVLLAGCGGGGSNDMAVTTPAPAGSPGNAFFYQNVSTSNSVRAGFTADGRVVDTYGVDVLAWGALNGETRIYGDPVVSRLANGRWAMMAGTGRDDPRGAEAMMYHEASCPRVDDSAVRIIKRSSAAGCDAAGSLVMAKVSQVFDSGGSNYAFIMANSKIMLVRLTDATRTALDLASICVRTARATSLAALQWSEATVVIDSALAPGLLLSDSAIARRADGTWVLFVKGIASSVGCSGGGLCELCARNIYRTTSRDLITWTALEKVVERASVPDASVAADGSVWLYWGSFAPACDAQDINLAARAPMMAAAETTGGALGMPVAVSFLREAFETDTRLHYPTNANPVRLPDAAAKTALDACFGR